MLELTRPRRRSSFPRATMRCHHLGEAARPSDPFVQDNAPARTPFFRRPWAAGVTGIAASAVALLLVLGLGQDRSMYEVATPPGGQQTVTLAGGTTIGLNGGTRVTLDRDDPRFAELHQGEAVFAVVHDDKRPFRVMVDGAELVDLGTRFTVLREHRVTEVAVSEGVVMFNPYSEAISPSAARFFAPPTAMRRSRSPNRSSSGRRLGRRPAVYDNPARGGGGGPVAFARIAVRADPAISARPVTAVIQLPRIANACARA